MPIKLFLFLSFLGAASAISSYESDNSCKIIGDADVYGVGIRISFYLQWAAAILLVAFGQSDEIKNIRAGSNVINIAIYINLILGVTQGTIVALDWQIVGLLTIALNVVQWLPNIRDVAKQGWSSYAVTLIFTATVGFASPWIFFKRYYDNRKENCELFIFLFKPFSTYSKAWVVLMKLISVAGCIGSVVALAVAVCVLFYGFRREWFEEKFGDRFTTTRDSGTVTITTNNKVVKKRLSQVNTSDPDMKPFRIVMRAGRIFISIGYFAIGALVIAFLEKTLHINQVDVSASSITSSGQLIPLLVGCFSVVMAIYKGLQGLARTRWENEKKAITWRPDEEAILSGKEDRDDEKDAALIQDKHKTFRNSAEIQEHITEDKRVTHPQGKNAAGNETGALRGNNEAAVTRNPADAIKSSPAEKNSFPLQRKGTPWV